MYLHMLVNHGPVLPASVPTFPLIKAGGGSFLVARRLPGASLAGKFVGGFGTN